jgi:hypothetical protein
MAGAALSGDRDGVADRDRAGFQDTAVHASQP